MHIRPCVYVTPPHMDGWMRELDVHFDRFTCHHHTLDLSMMIIFFTRLLFDPRFVTTMCCIIEESFCKRLQRLRIKKYLCQGFA